MIKVTIKEVEAAKQKVKTRTITSKQLVEELEKEFLKWKKRGRFIKEKRMELGITQKKLAEMLNISAPYLRKIEKGEKNMSIPFKKQIAKQLDCSIRELL